MWFPIPCIEKVCKKSILLYMIVEVMTVVPNRRISIEELNIEQIPYSILHSLNSFNTSML